MPFAVRDHNPRFACCCCSLENRIWTYKVQCRLLWRFLHLVMFFLFRARVPSFSQSFDFHKTQNRRRHGSDSRSECVQVVFDWLGLKMLLISQKTGLTVARLVRSRDFFCHHQEHQSTKFTKRLIVRLASTTWKREAFYQKSLGFKKHLLFAKHMARITFCSVTSLLNAFAIFIKCFANVRFWSETRSLLCTSVKTHLRRRMIYVRTHN